MATTGWKAPGMFIYICPVPYEIDLMCSFSCWWTELDLQLQPLLSIQGPCTILVFVHHFTPMVAVSSHMLRQESQDEEDAGTGVEHGWAGLL